MRLPADSCIRTTSVIVLAGVLATPYLIDLIAPGFEGETLWVGRRSEAARYLEALVADPSAILE